MNVNLAPALCAASSPDRNEQDSGRCLPCLRPAARSPSGSAPLRWLGMGPAALPPRTARVPQDEPRLRWPDGRTSAGRVEQTAAGTVFHVDAGSQVIKERLRKNKTAGKGHPPLTPRPLPVTRSGTDYVPTLAQLSDLNLMRTQGGKVPLCLANTGAAAHALGTDAVDAKLLASAANTAGGRRVGIKATEELLVDVLLADAIRSIASRCRDAHAAANAADALSAPYLEVGFVHKGGRVFVNREYCRLDPGQISDEIERLAPGQHRFINVVHEIGIDDHGLKGRTQRSHALALSATRLPADKVRITMVNPAGLETGWNLVTTAVCKTLEMSDAASALERLLAGEAPALPQGCFGAPDNGASEMGSPLHWWLKQAGPSGSRMKNVFDGATFRNQRQKEYDCGIEAPLSWLATVMPPADYKLAKAQFLGCLKELGQQAKAVPIAHIDAVNEALGSLHPDAAKRLNERMTTSLSGSTVAATELPAA